MPGNVTELTNLKGLSAEEVNLRRNQYGKNIFQSGASRGFLHIVWDIVKEPMFILLVIACSLYFILGEISEGIMMLVAMTLVTTISLFQEMKSTRAVEALNKFTEPKVALIRDGVTLSVAAEELVPGDIMLLEEGMKIPADAIILQENDLSVNESIITGESLPVDKHESEEHNKLYQGTTINTGKCIAKVTATGIHTELGKLGKFVGSYSPPKTRLQVQINTFVRRLALFGLLGFFVILFVNYFHHHEWINSLLFALTLAMSAVPEEIPVAFTSFMALGAFKMSKLGIISRQPQIIENLGAVTVICFDKTGTITENKMSVRTIYDYSNDSVTELSKNVVVGNDRVLRFAMLASEKEPFDAMEMAIWEAYNEFVADKSSLMLKMVFEYPLQGKPPMMTHVYENGIIKIVAAKGAPEKILEVCRLEETTKKRITSHVKELASNGYRIIAVASAKHSDPVLPVTHEDFQWHFEGLLAFYDPPKPNIAYVLKQFYNAGIHVKLVTGDYPETTINIAGRVGMPNYLKYTTGQEVMTMNADELSKTVADVNVFARMFPEAKMKVIEALKKNGEVVAMTGDGVNDGPALKSADIGIAMGSKGTEIARQASDLILTDDNIDKIAKAVEEGRKIFVNLKKAVRYIISIHIPIILVASLPVVLGWTYPNIFTPIHVIFMELIMGPTCSIFFEREPVEETNMLQKPRKKNEGLFTTAELSISLLQGLAIAAAALLLYYYFMNKGASLEDTRTVVFTTLLLSNVFLTFINRSFSKTIYHTSRYKNSLAPIVLIISVIFLLALHLIPTVRQLFQLTKLSAPVFWLCLLAAFVSVIWFDVYKLIVNKVSTSTK